MTFEQYATATALKRPSGSRTDALIFLYKWFAVTAMNGWTVNFYILFYLSHLPKKVFNLSRSKIPATPLSQTAVIFFA